MSEADLIERLADAMAKHMKTTAIEAIEKRPLTCKELAERITAYRQATAPLARYAADVYSLAMPRYLHHADGTIEMTDDGLDAGQKAILDECKRQMGLAAEACGLQYHSVNQQTKRE